MAGLCACFAPAADAEERGGGGGQHRPGRGLGNLNRNKPWAIQAVGGIGEDRADAARA